MPSTASAVRRPGRIPLLLKSKTFHVHLHGQSHCLLPVLVRFRDFLVSLAVKLWDAMGYEHGCIDRVSDVGHRRREIEDLVLQLNIGCIPIYPLTVEQNAYQ